MRVNKSEKLSATATDTIDLSQKIVHTPHVTIGIRFLNGAGAVVTPSAGTFSIMIKVVGNEKFHNIVGGNNIDATSALDELSFAGNGETLKYVPVSIAGAVTVEINLQGNES